MKKNILLTLVSVMLLFLGSCQSNSSRIDELKDLVEEINENGKDYSAEQWKKAEEKFTRILDKINSYDNLSQEELEEVAKLQGKYAAAVFTNSGKAIIEQMEKAGAALDGFLEGIQEETGEATEEGKEEE